MYRNLHLLIFRIIDPLWGEYMMTSSNGNIFRVTGHVEFTGPLNALMFSLICASVNAWVNNLGAGDLRRHRDYYDVTVMIQNNPQQISAILLCFVLSWLCYRSLWIYLWYLYTYWHWVKIVPVPIMPNKDANIRHTIYWYWLLKLDACTKLSQWCTSLE